MTWLGGYCRWLLPRKAFGRTSVTEGVLTNGGLRKDEPAGEAVEDMQCSVSVCRGDPETRIS